MNDKKKARSAIIADRALSLHRIDAIAVAPHYIIMQHIGMPFIITQHVQPGIIMLFMQSQHA
jgi:hypothetical protein